MHIKEKGVHNLGYATKGRYLRGHHCTSPMSACVYLPTYIFVCRVLAAVTQGRAYCNVSLTLTATAPRRIKQLRLTSKSPLAEPKSGAQRTRHVCVCVCDNLGAQKRLSSSDGLVHGIMLATAAESVRSCH
jgi:hypothetical protein